MKIFNAILPRLTAPRKPACDAATNAMARRLTRVFVQTGDERCPIAGIWLSLTETGPVSDEPSLIRPVLEYLLPWRAHHLLLTTL
jgi:hypothetical protein